MINLGNITKLSGFDVPAVDCVIGGSPCQDLSTAGRRAGLAGARSGLFMEQIRIIREMRDSDRKQGKAGIFIRPRFMVWENVPGAFSTNKGEDFRTVLEETVRIVNPDAVVPRPEKSKWTTSGCVMGDGWSIAWRVLDAQFWGVPQRRRRIALVADFGGHNAPEILFVRRSVSWDFDPYTAAGKEDTAGAGSGAYPAIRTDEEPGSTLTVGERHCVLLYENHGQDSRLTGPLSIAPTVSQTFGTGGNNTPLVLVMATGQANVRRLTPLECERLQGFPDGWTDIGAWTDSVGKLHKTSSDSARYKALGNSIALPPWKWVLKRLCACYERDATMASLFDGIGGFPLLWEQINGKGSCLWASEIDEFAIAVTENRFS